MWSGPESTSAARAAHDNGGGASEMTCLKKRRSDDRETEVAGELRRGAARRLHETGVGNLELSVIIHAQALRFVVAILDDTETDEVVWTQTGAVVEHVH